MAPGDHTLHALCSDSRPTRRAILRRAGYYETGRALSTPLGSLTQSPNPHPPHRQPAYLPRQHPRRHGRIPSGTRPGGHSSRTPRLFRRLPQSQHNLDRVCRVLPLDYYSLNAPDTAEILAGQRRYSHGSAPSGDAVMATRTRPSVADQVVGLAAGKGVPNVDAQAGNQSASEYAQPPIWGWGWSRGAAGHYGDMPTPTRGWWLLPRSGGCRICARCGRRRTWRGRSPDESRTRRVANKMGEGQETGQG